MSESAGWSSPGGGDTPQPPPGPPPGDRPPAGPPPGTAPQGYGQPQGYGPPQGFSAPEGYGAPQGYAPPPGWGGPQPGGGWGAPMAPKPGVVPLRPLGLGDVLDGAVAVIRRYPRPTIAVSVVLSAVATLLGLALGQALYDASTSSAEFGSDEFFTAVGAQIASALVDASVGVLIAVVLAGFLTAVVGRAVLGQPMTFAEVLTQVRPRLKALLGLTLLYNVAVFGVPAAAIGLTFLLASVGGDGLGALTGLLLITPAVLGAVYYYVLWALSPAVLVLEGAGIRASLRRSATLVRRAWWRTLGILLLVYVIAAFVGGVLQIPFFIFAGQDGLFSGADPSRLTLAVSELGNGVATAIVGPFGAAVTALLYVDRRMRAEGLDVALQASAAAAAPR